MIAARTGVREASLRAVVTRADGTTEDYGVVSYTGRNPLKALFYFLDNRARRAFYKSRNLLWRH